MNSDIQRAIDLAVKNAIAPLKTELANRNRVAVGLNSYMQNQFPPMMEAIKKQHGEIAKKDDAIRTIQSDIRDMKSRIRKLEQRINKYDLILDARQHVTKQGLPRRYLPGAEEAKKKITTLGKMQSFAHAGNVNNRRRKELKGSLGRAIERRSTPKNERGSSSNSFGSANSNILKNANTIYKTVKRKH
jgi:predicted  nucleic acid-binding Zn-ribbon protein